MDEMLRKLQLTQLEMLKLVDGICRENNIPYSLYAGTLLGAVRHQGFIPWDDDLDVCMSRDNYNRFIALWPSTKHDGYILQNKENAPRFSQSFIKIRKDHTTFLQSADEAGQYHTGIFIDIFPIDRKPNGKLRRGLFYWDCMRYQLFTREFAPERSGLPVKYMSKLILALVPPKSRKTMRERLLRRITARNDQQSLETVTIETIDAMTKSYVADLLDHYTTLRFENGDYMCFAAWDDYLRETYGDYMQLPPEEERTWKHHPIRIDFEHNFEELQQ